MFGEKILWSLARIFSVEGINSGSSKKSPHGQTLWCRGLNHCVEHQYAISWACIQFQALPPPSSSLTDTSGEAADDEPITRIPATNVGDPDSVQDALLQPGSNIVAVGIWGNKAADEKIPLCVQPVSLGHCTLKQIHITPQKKGPLSEV